jgi:hypothetical protein
MMSPVCHTEKMWVGYCERVADCEVRFSTKNTVIRNLKDIHLPVHCIIADVSKNESQLAVTRGSDIPSAMCAV